MVKLRNAIIAAAFLYAPASQASQPISESMAECAGIMVAALDIVQTPHRREFIQSVAEFWAGAATAEAGRDMDPVVAEKAEIWRAKGQMVGFGQDYRDWTDYCGSLARHKGLKYKDTR